MRIACVLALVIGVIGPVSAAEERLGDRVFFVRDKPGSATKFQMIVNAGCLDEADGQCRGLAHYLEHIVLVGRNPEHKDSAVRMFSGASANGWTNARATVYLHDIPAATTPPVAELEKLFGFYAARLNDFAITEEDAARERNVVLQEHDWRVQSNPFSRVYRDLWRRLLPDHPSGQWTIGTRDDIRAFTVGQARAFHQNWYAINNVWFAVSGDIEPSVVRDIANRTLAGVVPRPLPPRNFALRPRFVDEYIEESRSDPLVKQAVASVYKLVSFAEPDRAKNRAQRRLLGAFLTSQLPGSPYDVLVDRKKLATGRISVGIDRAAPETFTIYLSGSAAAGVDPALLREELRAYLDGLGSNSGLSAAAIRRLQARIATASEDADDEPRRVFSRLVSWLANRNDHADLARWPAVIAATEPDEVVAMARSFAGPGRIVAATLVPEVKAQ